MDLPHNILTLHEKQGAVWKKIEAYYKNRLETLRRQNDEESLDSTEKLRGRITECKHILSLGLDNFTSADS